MAALLTLTSANEESISGLAIGCGFGSPRTKKLFWLAPTRPPANVYLPTVISPCADDWVIVPTLKPTRPPTLLVPPLQFRQPSPTVIVTVACDCVIVGKFA